MHSESELCVFEEVVCFETEKGVDNTPLIVGKYMISVEDPGPTMFSS